MMIRGVRKFNIFGFYWWEREEMGCKRLLESIIIPSYSKLALLLIYDHLLCTLCSPVSQKLKHVFALNRGSQAVCD